MMQQASSTLSPPDWLSAAATQDISLQPLRLVVVAAEKLDICVQSIAVSLDQQGYSHDFSLHGTHAITQLELTNQQAWQLWQALLQEHQQLPCDLFIQPSTQPAVKLLLCDMDSTIIQGESLDDLAQLVGIGEQVTAITERAMRGEMDFRQALDERVALLAGLPIDIFDHLHHSIIYNPGAKKLLAQAQSLGIKCVLVSGGFEQIVTRVADDLGFNDYRCNQLNVRDGALTGTVFEPIIDGEAKRTLLLEQCQLLHIESSQVCAVGDGANDLAMLQTAGLGIGYRAKPLIRVSIANQINHNGLDGILPLIT